MTRPDTFSPSDIAGILGVGKTYVTRLCDRGQLKAAKISRGLAGGFTYRVTRDQLVSFLTSSGFPLTQLRRVMNPAGAVLVCPSMPPVEAALLASTPVYGTPTLFDLGRRLENTAAWAAVLNLDELGTTDTVRSIARYAAMPDRPGLVGLYGDDGIKGEVPFDLALPATTPPAEIARAVLTLRG